VRRVLFDENQVVDRDVRHRVVSGADYWGRIQQMAPRT
jgi:hypothetical protein